MQDAMASCLTKSRHFLSSSSHAMLWALLCLWLAQGPLLALTLTHCSKITFHKEGSMHVASKRVEG